jgi:hypothetical protein
LSITNEQLVGLIEDVRGSLNRGATAPATLETALAQLEVEDHGATSHCLRSRNRAW